MHLGVDFLAQDLLGAGHGQRCYLLAQLGLGRLHFLLDLRLGGGQLAFAFGLGVVLGLFHHLRGALLALRQDFLGALAGFADYDIALLGGFRQRRLAALGLGQALGDVLAAR